MKILDFFHEGYHMKNRSVKMYGGQTTFLFICRNFAPPTSGAGFPFTLFSLIKKFLLEKQLKNDRKSGPPTSGAGSLLNWLCLIKMFSLKKQ